MVVPRNCCHCATLRCCRRRQPVSLRSALLVDLQSQCPRHVPLHALHHPLPRPLAFDMDDRVIGIADEVQSAPLELSVKLVQHPAEREQQRRQRPALGRSLLGGADKTANHHSGGEKRPNEPQDPLVLHPSGQTA